VNSILYLKKEISDRPIHGRKGSFYVAVWSTHGAVHKSKNKTAVHGKLDIIGLAFLFVKVWVLGLSKIVVGDALACCYGARKKLQQSVMG